MIGMPTAPTRRRSKLLPAISHDDGRFQTRSILRKGPEDKLFPQPTAQPLPSGALIFCVVSGVVVTLVSDRKERNLIEVGTDKGCSVGSLIDRDGRHRNGPQRFEG